MKKRVLSYLVLVITVNAAMALNFEEVDLHPLLRVNASRYYNPQINPFPFAGHFDEVKVITRGGALFSVLTHQSYFSTPFDNHIVRERESRSPSLPPRSQSWASPCRPRQGSPVA
jgi:hypothetical protein